MPPAAIERFVRQRALDRCEYCLLPQAHHPRTFHIDHIIAIKHRADSEDSNLALACFRCNGCKGTNIAGLDPVTQMLAPLFNPRIDEWAEHFVYQDAVAVGLTPAGRVTVHILNMNDWSAIRLRRALILRGLFPLPPR